MRGEELLRHLGSVNDEYIEEIMTESVRTSRRRSGRRRMLASIAASLAVIILGTAAISSSGGEVQFGELTLTSSTKTVSMARNSVIMIDVNPSIRVEVNDREVVVAVTGLNDDAQKVLEGLELVGKSYEAAVPEIVNSLYDKGYITNLRNSLLISVASYSTEVSELILQTTVEAAAAVDETLDFGLSILSQVIELDEASAKLAEEFGISEGRVDAINRFINEHSDYSFETLAKNNIQLLNQLFEYAGLPEGIERLGEVTGVVPEDCEDKLNLDELNSNKLISFATAISDFYDKLSEYYSPEAVAKRIGYEFSIVESSTEDGQKLWAVLAESLTKNVGNHGAIINIGQNTVDWLNQNVNGKQVEDLVKAIIEAA